MALPVHDLPLFVAAALLLNLTPGPDMLYVAGTAAARGVRHGIAAALGIGAGCGVHIALGALGVSALIAASPTAFGVLKAAGAVYLVWAGIALWRRRDEPATRAPQPASAARAFAQGALVNALNPKVALFFLALLPQFIDAGKAGQAAAFVALGLLFDAGGTAVNIAVAAGLGLASGRLARAAAVRRWLERTAGALFVALGLRLALGARG
ncbi:MAG TPA: LysE family translocator [Burkholderiaceae bacterium]